MRHPLAGARLQTVASTLPTALWDLGVGLTAILFPPHCVVCEEPAPEVSRPSVKFPHRRSKTAHW
jgi:hypothetical protein